MSFVVSIHNLIKLLLCNCSVACWISCTENQWYPTCWIPTFMAIFHLVEYSRLGILITWWLEPLHTVRRLMLWFQPWMYLKHAGNYGTKKRNSNIQLRFRITYVSRRVSAIISLCQYFHMIKTTFEGSSYITFTQHVLPAQLFIKILCSFKFLSSSLSMAFNTNYGWLWYV